MGLLVFTQDQCSYCHRVIAFLKGNEAPFTEINISKQPEAAIRYDIMGTPTTILMEDGEEIARSVGFHPEELETIIENL